MKRSREDFYSDSDGEPEETGVKFKLNTLKDEKFNSGAERWGNRDQDDGESPSDVDASDSEPSSDEDINEQGSKGQEISLGQLIALKQDGSTAGPANKARKKALRAAAKGSFKREHKHRPVEMSSKKPVPVLRETLQGGKHHGRDPRFDPLTARGGNKDDLTRKRYSFLYDEKLPEEKRDLQDALKKTKSESKKEKLKAQLGRLTQATKSESSRRKKETADEEERAKHREARAAGKNPFYLKKSEKKRQELLSKYEELKSGGKLERFMEKRRKKNAAKDHRYLPSRRPDGQY